MPPYGLIIVIASLPVFFLCWANCHTVATIFSEFVSCKFGNHCKNLEKITKLLKLQNFGWGGKPWCWRALYLVHICKSKFNFTLFGTCISSKL